MRKSTQTKGPQAAAIAAKLTGDDTKRKTKLKPYKAGGRKPKKNIALADEDEDEDAGFAPKEFDLGTDFFYDDDDDDDIFFDDNPFYN